MSLRAAAFCLISLFLISIFLTGCATVAKPAPNPAAPIGESVSSPVIKGAAVGPNPRYPMKIKCSSTMLTCLEGTHQDCFEANNACQCECVKN